MVVLSGSIFVCTTACKCNFFYEFFTAQWREALIDSMNCMRSGQKTDKDKQIFSPTCTPPPSPSPAPPPLCARRRVGGGERQHWHKPQLLPRSPSAPHVGSSARPSRLANPPGNRWGAPHSWCCCRGWGGWWRRPWGGSHQPPAGDRSSPWCHRWAPSSSCPSSSAWSGIITPLKLFLHRRTRESSRQLSAMVARWEVVRAYTPAEQPTSTREKYWVVSTL